MQFYESLHGLKVNLLKSKEKNQTKEQNRDDIEQKRYRKLKM